MQKSKNQITNLVLTAMFAAMIAVTTAFVQIKSTTGGMIHIGDAVIYLAACFLPTPAAVAASAIGGGLADLLVYPETMLYTILIKAVNALFFSCKSEKLLTGRNALMVIPSGIVTVAGYSISKYIRVVLAGGGTAAAWGDALLKIPENTIQAVASGIIFIVVAAAFDKAQIKQKVLKPKN